jgi:hypothetical protein
MERLVATVYLIDRIDPRVHLEMERWGLISSTAKVENPARN